MRPLALAVLALAACWPRALLSLRVLLGAVAGALLVAATWQATFAGGDHQWAIGVTVVTVGAAASLLPLLPGTAQAFGIAWRGWRWLMVCGSAAAVYGCVPETDQMRDVAVVLLAGAVAEWLRGQPLPSPAFTAAWGLVVWSALFGATGRLSAVIGGLFAVVAPLAAGAVVRWGKPISDRTTVLVGSVWALAALVVARTGGIAMSSRPAVTAALIGGALAAGVSVLLVRLDRR